MGSNANFMENGLKQEEYAYPSDSSKIKNRHETFITPTKSHENKTPSMCRLVMAPGPPGPLKTTKNQNFDKIWAPGAPGVA